MAKKYSEAEFAAIMREQNPESLGKLSDSAVLQRTFKEFPDLKERLAPPAPLPAAPAIAPQLTMADLALNAGKAVAGQIAAPARALAAPAARMATPALPKVPAAPMTIPQIKPPAAGPEFTLQQIKATPGYEAPIIPQPALRPQEAAIRAVAEQLRPATAMPVYAGAGAVKGASMGYVDPMGAIPNLGVSDLNAKRAAAYGEFLGATLPISKVSQGASLALKAAGVTAATARPALLGLARGAAVGLGYGAARKPAEDETRGQNALNDAAVFMAFTGTAMAVDKAYGWYSANKTLPGAYAAARKQIIDVFVAKGAQPEKAAEMADLGLSASIARGGGPEAVTVGDLVNLRKNVAAGGNVVLPKVPEAMPAEQIAGPAAAPAAAPMAPAEVAATPKGSTLPAARQAEFRPTQVAVLQDVIARGDISPDEIATLVFDKAKDGITLRAMIERRLLETQPLPGGALNMEVVKGAADEYNGFLQGIKKTAAAQEAAAASTAPAVTQPAALPPAPAPKGKIQPWEMGDQELYDLVNKNGSFMSTGKSTKEITADIKKYRAMGAERKWAIEAEINSGRYAKVPPEVIKKYKLEKAVKTQKEFEAAERVDRIEAMRQENGGTLFPALELVKKAGFLNKQKVIDYLQMRPGMGWKGGEIPEELAWYIRPSGTMSPDGMADLAYRLGRLPENNTELFIENMTKQHAMKVKMEAGGDLTEITGLPPSPVIPATMYGARKPAPRLDLPGQTMIPGTGPAMPTDKIRAVTNVDQAAFLEGFQPEPAPAPGLFDEPKKAPSGDASTDAPRMDAAADQARRNQPDPNQPGVFDGQPARINAQLADLQPITADKEFKLWQATDDLINKYALRFGERQYIPRGAVGVFYQDTKNIYLQAANNVYVAVHEIVHYIDLKTGWFKTMLETVGETSKGAPIYSRKHAEVRKLLTQIYLDTYPGAKPGHPLKKRVKEGLAMLLQKAVESPEMLNLPQYKPLADMVLAPGAKYHLAEFDELVKDGRGVMKQYAALDDNMKIGARTGTRPAYKNTFFTTLDQVNEVLFDEGHKVYKLSKATGNQWGENDPYAQLMAYRYWGSIAESNMSARGKGLWILLNNNFVQVGDKNIADLFHEVGSADQAKRFNNWLIARRVRAGYQQIEATRLRVLALTDGMYNLEKPRPAVLKLWLAKQEVLLPPEQYAEIRAGIEQGIADYKEAAEVAANDNISKELAESAYTAEMKDGKFTELAKIHDAVKRAGVDMLEDAGMVSHEVAARWRADESYASMKRDIFTLANGEGGVRGPGGMSVGALKSRTGSELNLVGPLHAMATNHADIIRKTMRQNVINKFYQMAEENPEMLGAMFQREKLKVKLSADGTPEYPQLQDENYWMARENGKYKPLGVNDKDLKAVVENMLMNPDSIGAVEKALTFVSRQFVKGTTGLNPVFIVGNVPVDTISAAAQSQTGYKPFWDQMKMLKRMAMTENSEEARLLNEYLILGGHRNTLTGFLDENITPEEMYKKMVGETGKLQKMLDGAETVMDIISAPSKFSEDFTRAAEYIRSRQAGDSSVIAMEKAGQVSAPFHHHGTMGGRAGKIAIKATAYVNPAMQVAAQYAKTLGNKPTQKRAAVVMAMLTTAIIGSAAAVRMASDAQKRNYRGLPVRLKQNYIWYPLPGEKARADGLLGKVKIPSNYGVAGGLINMLIDDAMMGARYSASEYVQMATSPVPDQLNPTDFTRMLFSWVPRIIGPAMEVKMGKRTFPEVRDITPKDLQDLPTWQQKTEDSSYPAVMAAKTRLGQALNLSPIDIDYLVEGHLGTGTRFLTGRYGKKLLTRPFYTEMYLSGMRDLQFYYKLRDQVNREYQGARTLEQSPEGFTATPEFEKLMEFKPALEGIDLGMKEYRAYTNMKNPTEKDQADLRKLRTDILDGVEQLWIEYEKALDKK